MHQEVNRPHHPDVACARNLRRFIPPVLFQWPGFRREEAHQVAILSIDVAGLAALSEALADLGPEGAEILELTVSRYFDALLDVIDRYHGLPIMISGEMLTVVFPRGEASLRGAVARALACADALRPANRPVTRVCTPHGNIRLSHKMGVGSGMLLGGQVGDPSLQAELVFGGQALEQAVAASRQARPGEVWACLEVTRLIDRPAWWDQQTRGFSRLIEQPARELQEPPPMLLPPSPEAPPEGDALLERCRCFIPGAVREQAARGRLRGIARYDSLVVMVAGCPELRIDSLESLHRLDAHYRQMQRLIETHGGFLSELEGGERGARIMVLFGAPTPLEDPFGQAVRCAGAMIEASRELGVVQDLRIGMASGRLFAGRIGCRSIVRYSALGDRAELAGRLMASAGRWAVQVEREVADHTVPVVRWSSPHPLRARGNAPQLEVCTLLKPRDSRGKERRGKGYIGHHTERVRCLQRVNDLVEHGRGSILYIRGPAGSGKTRLLEVIRRLALERGCTAIAGWSDQAAFAPGSPRPLEAWRPLLLTLIGASGQTTPEALALCFERWVAGMPDGLRRKALLLGAVAGVQVPLPAGLSAMPPARLLQLRIRGLAACLVHATRGRPHLLLLDDSSRLDDASARVVLELAPQIRSCGLMVAVTGRYSHSCRRGPLEMLRPDEQIDCLELGPLAPSEVARLAARRLQVRTLDPELEAFLADRAKGNALLIEAWCDLLRDQQCLQLTDQEASLLDGERPAIPSDQIEALILSRVRRLPLEALLTLQVASVVGATLNPEDVATLHPEGISVPVARTHLLFAVQAGLLRYDRGRFPRLFFSRPEAHRAIHDSLSHPMRRALHIRWVMLLRLTGDEATDGDLAIELANHYRYIDEPDQQRRYFGRAMEVCVERTDPRGTVRWGRRLLEVCERQGDRDGFLRAVPPIEGALKQLGECNQRLELIRRWIATAEEAGAARSLVDALRSGLHRPFEPCGGISS